MKTKKRPQREPGARGRVGARDLIGGRGKRGRVQPWRYPARVSLAVAVAATIMWRHASGPGGDALDYVDAANHLTGPSRFPPGFPLLLASFTGSWWAMEASTLLIALALVTAIWWGAVRVGGWTAGTVAGPLMLMSPGVTSGGSAVMSDRLGALLIVGAFLAVLHERPMLAGFFAGLSGWVRLVHVAFCAALPRRAWPAAAVMVGLLAAWQLGVKGSVFGYRGVTFAVEYVTGPTILEFHGNPAEVPNLGYFPAVLTVGFGRVLAPLAIVPAVIGLRRHWSPGARYATGIVAVNLLVYLPYYWQSARFMLPAACLILVYASVTIGGWITARPRSRRTPTQSQQAVRGSWRSATRCW